MACSLALPTQKFEEYAIALKIPHNFLAFLRLHHLCQTNMAVQQSVVNEKFARKRES